MTEFDYSKQIAIDEQEVVHELRTHLRPVSPESLRLAIYERTVGVESILIPDGKSTIVRTAASLKIKNCYPKIVTSIISIFAFVLGMGTMYIMDRMKCEHSYISSAKTSDLSEVPVIQTDNQNPVTTDRQTSELSEKSQIVAAQRRDIAESRSIFEDNKLLESTQKDSLEPLLMGPFMLTDAQFDRLLKLREKQMNGSPLLPSYQTSIQEVPLYPNDLRSPTLRMIRTEEDVRRILGDRPI